MTTIVLHNETAYHLLYSSVGFVVGLTVTGYFIYPDLSKSDVFTFDNLGDGIYAAELSRTRPTNPISEKYGLVIKENGVVKKFEIVKIHY